MFIIKLYKINIGGKHFNKIIGICLWKTLIIFGCREMLMTHCRETNLFIVMWYSWWHWRNHRLKDNNWKLRSCFSQWRKRVHMKAAKLAHRWKLTPTIAYTTNLKFEEIHAPKAKKQQKTYILMHLQAYYWSSALSNVSQVVGEVSLIWSSVAMQTRIKNIYNYRYIILCI